MSLCKGCMKEKGDEQVCPLCGLNETDLDSIAPIFLRPGTILKERYIVGVALGQGGFGITYIGYDKVLNARVAIKEYFPSDIAGRISETGTVSAYTQGADDFGRGKERFLEEARTLAKFSDHPCIVGVKDCFAENETAYMIMEYLDGISLKEYLNRKGGRLSVTDSISILSPIMDALSSVHKEGIIHRDISPDNIFITTDGRVRLIDFGAARQTMGGSKSLSVMLKPGYAPEEQYRTRGNQGPWTDVYALTATLYRMITGEVPPDALERVMEDTLVIPDDLPQNIQAALQIGLAVRASERYSSIEQLQAALNGQIPGTQSSILSDTVSTKRFKYDEKKSFSLSNKSLMIIVLIVLFVLVSIVSAVIINMFYNKDNDNDIIPDTSVKYEANSNQQKQTVDNKPKDSSVNLPDLYSPSLKYKGMSGIENAQLITSKEEYDKICQTINGFANSYSQFVAFGNGSESDYRAYVGEYAQVGSLAYKSQWDYYSKWKISYYNVESLTVRSAKKNDNIVYAWDEEIISEIRGGQEKSSNDHWIYKLIISNGNYYLIDYIKDPAY